MASENQESSLRSARFLIVAVVGVFLVIGLVVIGVVITQSATAPDDGPVDALAASTDDCVACHRRTTPGIVEQYGHSTMAAADILCTDCHEVEVGYPGSTEHEGTNILAQPTTAMCEKCHQAEVAQYNQSRHGLPAYVAYAGQEDLTAEQLAMYEAVPEGGFNPERLKERNALAELEGPNVTRFACEECHNIGKPAADESVGQCTKCHLRHKFSLEQARKPETCNFCHIGPDHPQFEIYAESPHGIAYLTDGHTWNWEAEPGTLTVSDFPAPTCATCHMSGFGSAGTTHDVGERLTWYLFAPVSERRPSWQDNKVRMIGACTECHNQNFIEAFYADGDLLVEDVNAWVEESQDIVEPLRKAGLLTDASFDEPIDYVYFELWHHWGRTTKFGAWMQGPDYTQWHGAYEVLSDLAELKEMAAQKLEEAGLDE